MCTYHRAMHVPTYQLAKHYFGSLMSAPLIDGCLSVSMLVLLYVPQMKSIKTSDERWLIWFALSCWHNNFFIELRKNDFTYFISWRENLTHTHTHSHKQSNSTVWRHNLIKPLSQGEWLYFSIQLLALWSFSYNVHLLKTH